MGGLLISLGCQGWGPYSIPNQQEDFHELKWSFCGLISNVLKIYRFKAPYNIE